MIIRYNGNSYDLSKKIIEEQEYKGLWEFLQLVRRQKNIWNR